MLQVEAVSKLFRGGKYGVRDLSLEARPGVLGLLGPNGAGKTTFMQMIATVTKPTGGRILFDGKDVAKEPEAIRGRSARSCERSCVRRWRCSTASHRTPR